MPDVIEEQCGARVEIGPRRNGSGVTDRGDGITGRLAEMPWCRSGIGRENGKNQVVRMGRIRGGAIPPGSAVFGFVILMSVVRTRGRPVAWDPPGEIARHSNHPPDKTQNRPKHAPKRHRRRSCGEAGRNGSCPHSIRLQSSNQARRSRATLRSPSPLSKRFRGFR